MGFFDKLDKAEGGYIFLSHSHQDIKMVRKIRNQLEADGFEPLCFYLKCLDDDSEIEDLIKREIDAREWFIFIDSENSKKSTWVTMEREYITRTNSKKIITINIDNNQALDDTLHKIAGNLRVFISHSHKNEALARRIKNAFVEKDYLVFFAPDSTSGEPDSTTVIQNAILEASAEGCVLALITPDFLESVWAQRELAFAIHNAGNIVPVLVGNCQLDPKLQFALAKTQQYFLPENPTDEAIHEMIDRIGQAILM